MSGSVLRHLSYFTVVASLGAGCAASEDSPGPGPSGGTSADAGAPDGDSGKGGGGSASGGTSAGGSSAAGKGGTDSAGEGGTAGSQITAGNGAGGSAGATGQAGEAGSQGDAGTGAGGAPDAGCSGPADCNDDNPCTTDSCEGSACQHVNNTAPCADDENECTTDVCQDGQCQHVGGTGACADDNDPCTNDVCAGDQCTHPANNTCQCQKAADCNDSNPCTTDACVGNQCQYTNNSLACATDNNPCTDDVCSAGACTHPNNTDSCTDDGDACTTDLCSAGACQHSAVQGCCSGDGDCYDANPCTTDACVNAKCQYANNTSSCPGDASPCTNDVCSAGACTHPNNAVCSGSDDVVILANRNSRYVVLNAGYLEWTGTSGASAEVFTKVDEVGTQFKLRARSTGLYVTLGAADVLVASADAATAMVFDAAVCAAPWVGLRATTDQNGGAFAAADDGNRISSRSGTCGAASATSWEKFQLLSVTAACSAPADCNDNNPCTDETCTGGFCSYTDHVGNCADDGNACTSDVCNSGTCTHPGNGTCAGPLVTIQVNRNAKFVRLNAGYLEYTANDAATAEKFELVDQVGTQFRLRASNSQFVTLDANDAMIANATFATSMQFDAPVCDVKVGLIALGDDDADKYLAADAANRLVARSGGCGLGNAGSWEKFTLTPAP